MGISIIDRQGANLLTVGATSKAARGTLYDSRGNVYHMASRLVGSYSIGILMANPTVTSQFTTPPATMWRMHSYVPGVFARIRLLRLQPMYVSVASTDDAPSTARWDVHRFSGLVLADPPTVAPATLVNYMGATAAQPDRDVARKRGSIFPRSVMKFEVAAAATTPLDVNGLVAEAPFLSFATPRSGRGTVNPPYIGNRLNLAFPRASGIWLDPGQGIAVRLQTAEANVSQTGGDTVSGTVEWDEIVWERLPWA
jgi:hypothetical protein